MRVLERFSETLKGFTVRQIERVQNRELWEDFMTWVSVPFRLTLLRRIDYLSILHTFFRRKKEQMKISNKNERYSERLLFHGTRSSLVDEVCHRNFQEFDASAYGKGMFLLQSRAQLTKICSMNVLQT